MRTLTLLLLAASPALAQGGPWTPGGGGTHSGWDWTPPNATSIGGEHLNQNVFTILDGTTVNITGGAPAFVDAANIVIDGNLNAVNQNVTLGSDSAGGSIMTPGVGSLPTLISPQQASFGPALPVFDWNDVSPPGTIYDVEISLNGVWGPVPIGAVTPPLHANSAFGLPTMPTQLPAAVAFPEGANVFWRVRVSPAGPFSETWGFKVDTQPPPPVALLAPVESGTVASETPLFDWTDVFDTSGVTYTLVVDDDCAFGSPEITQVGLLTSDFLAGAALAPGTYCWQVTVIDGAGNMTTSAVGTFTVGSPPVEDGSYGSHGGGGGCSLFGFAAPAGSPLAALALTALAALRRRRTAAR